VEMSLNNMHQAAAMFNKEIHFFGTKS